MNRKFLTILWLFIIAGTAFIAINIFKPTPSLQEDIDKLTAVNPTGKNQKISDIKIPVQETTKTYKEYISNGDSYSEIGDFEKAASNYQKASNLDPKSTEALNKLAESYLNNNQAKEAKNTFNLASNLSPDAINFKIGIARAHINLREIENAKTIIWKLDDKNPSARYYRGIISILYKNFPESKSNFEEIAKLTPSPDPAILDKTQKFLDTFKNFSYYKGSDDLYLELMLAKNLTDTEEYNAAIPLIYDILNAKNNYRDAWVILGFAYLNTGKNQDAIDALLQAKDLTPEKPETAFFLGLSYFANNEIDKAIHYIELADKYGYEPKDQVSLKLADLYLLKKNYKKSALNYEKVIALNPKKLEIYTRAVWLNLDQLNKPEKALTIATKALEFHKDKAMSYNLVGWSYTALGDFPLAQKNLETALKMDPKLDAAYLNLGWLYEKQNEPKLAQEYYKKAYKLGKGNSIANLAAIRFNKIDELQPQKNFQVNVSR